MELSQRTLDVARLQRAFDQTGASNPPATVPHDAHVANAHVANAHVANAHVANAHVANAQVASVAAPRHPATRVRIDLNQLRANRGVLPNDPGPAAQAYRMLRTQLLQRIRKHGARSIGVISAVDGEGKTLTALNLALGMAAESNQNVLLVDLDLRRPSLARLLGLPGDQGLEAWFAGVTPIGDLCRGIEGIDRLEVIPTLAPVSNSSETLASRRTQDMLRELKAVQNDGLVLFDLPPVLLTDDFLTVSPILDGVVLVASEGITRREDVTRTLSMLGSVRLLGTVLNRASESERRAY